MWKDHFHKGKLSWKNQGFEKDPEEHYCSQWKACHKKLGSFSLWFLGRRLHLSLPPLRRQGGHLLDIINLLDLWEVSEQIP